MWRERRHSSAADPHPATLLPQTQPPEDGSGETGDDGYASVGGTSAASLRAWLRHMREFTYQVGGPNLMGFRQRNMLCGCLGSVSECKLAAVRHAQARLPGKRTEHQQYNRTGTGSKGRDLRP